MPNSADDDPYVQWSLDAELLAEIGEYLNRERHPVQVRLSRDLAMRAIEAWKRVGTIKRLSEETHEQFRLRSAAATLSLIGLTLESQFGDEGSEVTFVRGDGEDITFELDAGLMGFALEVADDAGVLTNESD